MKTYQLTFFLRFWLAGLLALAGLTGGLLAQNALPALQSGLPFFRFFEQDDYQGSTQNWAVGQDRRGLIYVGNNLGVLEFDGTRWRKIRTRATESTPIRSLDLDENNRIFVGATGEFGYLSPDSGGALSFVNLVPLLPADQQGVSTVWQTLAIGKSVFFRTAEVLFRYRQGELSSIRPQNRFHVAFKVDSTLYIRERQAGLKKLVGDSLVMVRGGERFGKTTIYAMLPLQDGRILIGTGDEGLYVMDSQGILPFPGPAHQLLTESLLYFGAALRDGTIALGTRRNGVLLLDQQGELLQVLNSKTGLRNDYVHHLFEDARGNIWAALDDGLACWEWSLPIRTFNSQIGLKGQVLSLQKFQGRMFAGSNQGLFQEIFPPLSRMAPGEIGTPYFEAFPEINNPVSDFLAFPDQLLIGTGLGVMALRDNQILKIETPWRWVTVLLRSRKDPNLVFAGTRSGLAGLRFQQGTWIDLGLSNAFTSEITSLAQDSSGALWVGTNFDGVFRLKGPGLDEPGPFSGRVVAQDNIEVIPGLPARSYTYVNRVGENILIGNNSVVMQYDPDQGKLVRDPLLWEAIHDSTLWCYIIQEDGSGNLWLKSEVGHPSTIGFARLKDGKYGIEKTPLSTISNFGALHEIYLDSPGETWFGGSRGAVRYKPPAVAYPEKLFPARIRSVQVNQDSLIFLDNPVAGETAAAINLPHAMNALRFEVATPIFSSRGQPEFQFLLKGFDRQWSNWTTDTRRDYTNLPEDDYLFMVRSRDLDGRLSPAGEFAFTILPPWYRSWWANLLYLALFALGLLLFANLIILRQRQRAARDLEREREKAALREAELKLQTLETRKELEKEQVRNRIARDLHDELSATLSSIYFFSEALKGKEKDPSGHGRYVDLIAEGATDAQEKVQDIIWSINSANDSWEELLIKCRRFASDLLDSKEIDYEIDLPDNLPQPAIDMEQRRDFWLMFKEIVTNIARHSRANGAFFGLSRDGDFLKLEIRDDGIGFEASQSTHRHGLKNIRTRAEKLGATCQLQTAPDRGTHWTILMKIAGEANSE